jgi:predicted nucleotidyltransferase
MQQRMTEAVPDTAREEVLRRLREIEEANGARILLAVESGSRAWGFHSPDSDYDVRFIFVRSEDEYLSLSLPRDVIETPIEGLFDVNGWDLSKALRLMIKGNSVVHEWLASPHVYRWSPRFVEALTPIAQAWRNAYADAHHYYGLLATQRGRFIAGRDEINLKKYFYVVRPALALQWLRERGGAPPMDLPGLLAGLTLPGDVSSALERLRAAKRASSEVGVGPPIAELDAYIEEQAQWGSEAKGRPPSPDPELLERSNALFRSAVRAELG